MRRAGETPPPRCASAWWKKWWPKGGARDAALALADKVGRQSPVAVSACKTLVQRARHAPPAANLIHERELFIQLFDSEDQREGVNAFLEKRAPVWKNA